MSGFARCRPLGSEYCIYRVRTSHAANSRRRQHSYKKGAKCRQLVMKERIVERGIAICGTHWPLFLADVERDKRRRDALRDKFDPGPLYGDL